MSGSVPRSAEETVTETIQRLRVTAVLELDAALYPPDDEQAQDWLVNDILLGDIGRLILHSNEIGDSLGILRVETVGSVSRDQPTEAGEKQ